MSMNVIETAGLGKPFAFEELIARVRSLARRAPAAVPVIVRGDVVFDRARRRVSRAGRPLSLTRKEMGILEELLVADGGVVSTEDLLERPSPRPRWSWRTCS